MNAAKNPWIWLTPALVRAVHDEQLVEHGGPAGLRDEDLLSSALNRPQHRALYEAPDIADLAASYAFGIARNHPFVDGNKRTAAVVSETFLMLNGYRLACGDVELVITFLALAAGELSVEVLGAWFRAHIEPVE